MTMVADVLAVLRSDASSLVSGAHQGEQALHSLEQQTAIGAEKLTRFREAAGIAATAIGGTFTAALVAGVLIAREYTNELERMQVQFGALLGSSGAATNQIRTIEDFSAKMGLSVAAVSNMSQRLEILTQGQHDTTREWKAFADEAAAVGIGVDRVAESFGRAFQLLQRQGGGTMYATRSLLSEGLISPDVANQVSAMAKAGADMNTIWNTLIEGAGKYKGAADAAAGTMRGLSATFHDLLTRNVGDIFQPLIIGAEHVLSAVNRVMQSEAFKGWTEAFERAVEHLSGGFDNLAHHIERLSSTFSGVRLTQFISDLSHAQAGLGVVIGLLTEFGAEFVGHLPILNRFAGPFVKFLDDGRGGLIGLLIATKESREALVNFAKAALHLAESVFATTGPIESFLQGIAHIAAMVLDAGAAVLNFVNNNSVLISVIEGVVGALVGLFILDKIIKTVYEFGDALIHSARALIVWVENFGKKHAVQDADMAANAGQQGSVVELTVAIERLNLVITQNASALMRMTEVGALSTSVNLGEIEAINANLAAWDANTVAVTENSVAKERNIALGLGIGGGLMLGGGAAALAGSQMGGAGGKALTLGGDVLMGAGLGTMFGPGVGTAIGAVAGLALGLAQVAHHAHNAADAMNELKRQTAEFTSEWEKGNPSDNSSWATLASNQKNAVNDLQAAKAQLAHDMDPILQAYAGKGGGGTVDKEAIATDHARIASLEGISKAASEAAGNGLDMLQGASAVTGKSLDELASIASNLDIDLTLSVGTRKGMENLQALEAAAGGTSAALENISVTTDRFVKYEDAQFDAQAKNIEASQRGAEANLRNFQQTKANADAEYQRTQTLKELTKAQEQLARAELDATVIMEKAYESRHKAQESFNNAQAGMTDANRVLNHALSGQQDIMPDLASTVDQMTGSLAPYVSLLQESVDAEQRAKDTADSLNRTYTEEQNQLTKLTDQQTQYQNILNKPLQGTSAYDTELHNLQNASTALQVQYDMLMGQGHFSNEPMLIALKNQQTFINNQSSILQGQKALDIGDKQFVLNQVANAGKEVSFNTALDAASNVGELGDTIDSLKSSMDKEKPAIDDANSAYDRSKQKTDLLTGAIHQVIGATNTFANASVALSDAEKGITAATQQVKDMMEGAHTAIDGANHALSNLVDDAHQRALQAQVEKYAEMKNNITDAKNSLHDLVDASKNGLDSSGFKFTSDLGQIAKEMKAVAADTNLMTQLNQAFGLADNPAKKSQIMDIESRVTQNVSDIFAGKSTTPVTFDINSLYPLYTNQPHPLGMTNSAEGNIFMNFAGGGQYENHTAQLSNVMRVWAEPETGGEAYIPLGASKRDRSLGLLSQVADMFGYSLIHHDMGSITGGISTAAASSAGLVIHPGAINVDIHGNEFKDSTDLAEEVHDAVSDALRQLASAVNARGGNR